MNLRTRRVLAVAFSILIVTATLTPATAALEPASADQSGGLLGDFSMPLSGHDNEQGNGNENKGGGGPNQTTTTQPPTTTTSPEDNNTTTTTKRPGNGNGSQGSPNGSTGPPNGSEGPPEDSGGGPPENPGEGSSENPGNSPPENPGGGPPSWAGGNGDDDRGPPEWVTSSQTPPGLDGNRSALGNNSSIFQNASINVSFSESASAVDYRLAAIDALQDADFDGPGRSADQHRTEALEALDDSLPYVLDANRTTAARLFELDKEASTPPQFAPNVTKLLARSDQQLARTAIADAERISALLEARNVSFNKTAVEENITDARATYDRADRFRNRGQHHTAISQYRVAWIHAQQALDVLDLATTPNVTITTHEDLPHEGNVTYAVRGRVFDVRGHELDLVLSLNGVNRTIPLAVNTTPGTVGTFEVNVTLTQQVNRIEVTATDPNRRWSPEYESENATTGRDLLRLDADGLPDYYELNVTGTDPLAPDSNSTYTASDESDNAITDGAEDFDSDGETAYDAYRFGTDPLDNDTDGDRLLDGFELQFQGMDPLTAYTDNDRVADSAEDLDSDTLSNLREQNASTSPVRPDTDRDTLNDSEEVANGTDPLALDTDDDGLTDPDEYEVGTDPTVADTDGDGVLDGNETFSTTATNETVGAAVNISGEGNVADTVTISNETNEQIQTDTVSNASASEVLHVQADAKFEQANLSIDYDEKQVENESALAVYTYDPKLQTYRKLPSSVDAENNSVTGTTPHFSTFVVLNESAWNEYMESRAKPKPTVALNETFADLGGWNCTGDCSVGGGRAIVGQNASTFFDDDVSIACQGEYLPETGECVNPGDGNETDDDDAGNETDGDDGDDGNDDSGSSDPNPPKTFDPADLAKSLTIPDDAVGVTVTMPIAAFAQEANASVEVVVSVGTETRTAFELQGKDGERVTDYGYIHETFQNPGGQQVSVWVRTENLSGASPGSASVELKRDSDGDDLTNGLEKLGIKTGTGRIYTDPYDADTDGDGINDGKEVAGYIPHYVDGGYFNLNSDPTEVDSDSDSIDDYEEWYGKRIVRYTESKADSKQFLAALYDGGDPGDHLASRTVKTDPYRKNSDGDDIPDGEELELGTDPSRADTDGDEIADDTELRYDTDPTLHDYEGPEISVFGATFWTTTVPPETHYRIGYSASDPSGVSRVQYVKDGETEVDLEFEDAPTGASGTHEFTTGPVESINSALGGTTVDVKAADRHDNTRRVVALERTNFYGEVADELGSDTIMTRGIASDLGKLSGFSTGAGSTLETVTAIAENPLGFLDSISQVVTLLRNLGLLDDLINAFFKQLQEKQKLNNPYDKDTEPALYNEYRDGWYAGYLSYVLVSMVVGGQASKAAKNTKTFAKLVDKLDRNGKITTASRYLDAVESRTTGKAKRVTYQLGTRAAKGSWAISRQSGQHVVSGVKTAVAKYDVSQKLSNSKDSTLDELDALTQKRQRSFAQFTARVDDNDADVENVDELAEVLEEVDDVDPDTAERLAKLDSNGEDIDPLLEAYDTGYIDNSDLRRAAKLLDSRDDDYDEYYVGNDVSAEDLAEIADEGADLSETELVVKPKNTEHDSQPNTLWLELGDATEGGEGWLHIATRHITASQDGEAASLFPVGQTVIGEKIPNTLSIAEVKELIYLTVRHGKTSGGSARGKIEYMLDPREHGFDEAGISQMRVVIQPDGSIETAFPEKGDAVRTAVPGHGVK